MRPAQGHRHTAQCYRERIAAAEYTAMRYSNFSAFIDAKRAQTQRFFGSKRIPGD